MDPSSPGNYRARVFAASVDLTQLRRPGQAAQLDPQFNISSAWSQQTVQVQSVGTLRVVPAPDIAPVLPPEPDVVGGIPVGRRDRGPALRSHDHPGKPGWFSFRSLVPCLPLT